MGAATVADDVTLGEVVRRVDRMDAEITRRLTDLSQSISTGLVPVDLWRTSQGDLERRVSQGEQYRERSEARFRASVVGIMTALASSWGGILVAVLTRH